MFTQSAGRKLAMILTLTAFSYVMLAASGGGNKKAKTSSIKATATKSSAFKPLSLRSGFSFRGNHLINLEEKKPQFIQFRTYVTVKQGDKNYVVPFTHNVGVQPGQLSTKNTGNYREVRLINLNLNK
jgi:hypothetical protein